MSNKCPRCNKTVYANEKVRALNKDFHKSCFKCMTCNCTLQLGAENCGPDSMPYCKKCYGSNFGPRGFGHGATIAQGSQVQHEAPAKFFSEPAPLPNESILSCPPVAGGLAAPASGSPPPAAASTSSPAAARASTSPKFCPECGTSLAGSSAKFCPECGHKF
eukprot:m51a1_g4447 hypothetical protein (162) ;mRNA; f:139110-140057